MVRVFGYRAGSGEPSGAPRGGILMPGVPISTWAIVDDTDPDSGFGTMGWNGENNVHVLTFDPGTPAHRENIEAIVGQSGESDLTAYHSGRLVVATLRLSGSPEERHFAWRWLAKFTRPDLRPYIYWERPGVGPCLAYGRCWISGVVQPAGRALLVQFQMRVPSGVWLDQHTFTVAIFPSTVTSTGRTYPLIFPRVYPAGSGSAGGGLIFAGGTTYSPAVIRIYGPGVDPDFTLTSPSGAADGRWKFSGLTLLAGDHVEIDVEAGTVLLNGDPALARYDKLDFSVLAWGRLVPGNNFGDLAFASGTDSNSQAIVSYRNALL